jgi:hypothetical protein
MKGKIFRHTIYSCPRSDLVGVNLSIIKPLYEPEENQELVQATLDGM